MTFHELCEKTVRFLSKNRFANADDFETKFVTTNSFGSTVTINTNVEYLMFLQSQTPGTRINFTVDASPKLVETSKEVDNFTVEASPKLVEISNEVDAYEFVDLIDDDIIAANVWQDTKPVAVQGLDKGQQNKEKGEKIDETTRALMTRICKTLLMFRTVGVASPKIQLVALYCGNLNHESKSFRTAKHHLVAGGYTVPLKSSLSLTEDGIELAGTLAHIPKTSQEMVDLLLRNNGKIQQKMRKMMHFMRDGKVKVLQDMAKELGYANIESKGSRETIKWLVKHFIMEQVGHETGAQRRFRITGFLMPFQQK